LGDYASEAMGTVTRHADDVALVERVLARDAAAQRQLLGTLLPHLRVVARTLTRNPADVDDAVQLGLMRVLEGLSSYRGESSLVRWSRRVGSRVCLRLREQDGRRLQVVTVGGEDEAEAASAAPAPARLGDALPRRLSEYLDALPDAQREVLMLRHVLEHTVPEIAELLDLPVDTVKSRLLYARRAIRKSIRRDQAIGLAHAKGARS
jgi:RNA polymerase sigma-70 factor (ECF subfamily)